MTMTIRHHLTDALLLAYSGGQLPEAFNLVVATHLTMCLDCRARAEAFDAVGGAMLEDGPGSDMGDESLRQTMTRIAAAPVVRRAPPPRRGVLPGPLQAYVGGDLDAVRWRPIGMGVRQAILPTARGATARLLHIPSGQAVPDHGHRGMELTLVLRGAFQDATDRFAAGDVEIASEDLKHTPVAEPGTDCLCLAATDAALRFTAFLPRMLQPLFRI